MRKSLRQVLTGASAIAALAVTISAASAGGFAVREQSATHQGASFAGNAAGGSLSAMFWNSAAAAMAPAGIYSENHYSAILANSEITGDVFAGGVNLGLPRFSDNIADPAVVPASYMSYRLSPSLVAAIAITSPFGLVTEPNNRFWAGQTYARTSEIKTYNFNPTLAYKLSPTLSVGVGLMVEHIEGRLKSASGITPASLNAVIKGDDTSFGFTAGVLWQPHAGTTIGLGYRSSIDHTLEGTFSIPGSVVPPANAGVAIRAGVTLPEIVTLSIRQALNPQWTVLGTVEWTNWSRLQNFDVVCANNAAPNPVFCPAGNGQLARRLALGWHDGWFLALGAEYAYSPQLMLRGGLAYEISPVQDADERSLRVPDADRIWASVGASYRWSQTMTLDFAYTHIFVDEAPIDRVEGGLRFIGSADTGIDIVSVAMRMQIGAPAVDPLK